MNIYQSLNLVAYMADCKVPISFKNDENKKMIDSIVDEAKSKHKDVSGQYVCMMFYEYLQAVKNNKTPNPGIEFKNDNDDDNDDDDVL